MPNDFALYTIQLLLILKARCESARRLVEMMPRQNDVTYGSITAWDMAINLIDEEIERLEKETA